MKLNVVPSRTGAQWVRLGVRTFFRQPLALAGLFFMYMALVLVVSQLPVVGVVIGGMLVPAATLGLMVASAEAAKGKFPMPSVLLSAFRAGKQRARAMLVLGAIYTTGSILASGLATLLAGTPTPEPGSLDATTMIALLLHLPLFVVFWHAPALAHWYGVAPAKCLFFSGIAVWRNLGAHIVYALGWLLLFLAVGSVLGLVGGMLGGPSMAQSVMIPTALLLAAMFTSSIYFTFRDCFDADPAGETDA
jgi:hypothetical protein